MKRLLYGLFAMQTCFALTCSPCVVSYDVNDKEIDVAVDINYYGDSALVFIDIKSTSVGLSSEVVEPTKVVKIALLRGGNWCAPIELFETDEDVVHCPMCVMDDEGKISVNWKVGDDIWGTEYNGVSWEPVKKLIQWDNNCESNKILDGETKFLETAHELYEIGKTPFEWRLIGPAIGTDSLGNRLFWDQTNLNNKYFSILTPQKDKKSFHTSTVDIPEEMSTISDLNLCLDSQNKMSFAVRGRKTNSSPCLKALIHHPWFSFRKICIEDVFNIDEMKLAMNCKDETLLVWQTQEGIYSTHLDSFPDWIAPTVSYGVYLELSNDRFHLQADPTGPFVMVWQNASSFLGFDPEDNFREMEFSDYSVHGAIYDPQDLEWSRIERLSPIEKNSTLRTFKIGTNGQNLLVWTEWDLKTKKFQMKVGSIFLE